MRRGRFGPGPLRLSRLAASTAVAVAAVGACAQRERLTFDPGGSSGPGNGQGPHSIIEAPAVDTAVDPGTTLALAARARDADGIDSIVVEVWDVHPILEPYVITDVPRTDVAFSLPITVEGAPGDTISILVFATDLTGARGDTAIRRIGLR